MCQRTSTFGWYVPALKAPPGGAAYPIVEVLNQHPFTQIGMLWKGRVFTTHAKTNTDLESVQTWSYKYETKCPSNLIGGVAGLQYFLS